MKNLITASRPTRARLNEYFVTISLDDEAVKPEKIPEYMSKVCKKKWIEEYMYCIEQRSEEEDFYEGFHVHMYVKPNKSIAKSDLIREIFSSMKKYVKDKNFIDVKNVNRKQGVIDYMEGKKEFDKMKKVENDKPFREKYKLEEIYKS